MDEDDIAACITRKLIESDEYPYFNEQNISFSSGPVRDKTSITSIVNVYDNVQRIVAHKLKVKITELEKFRFRDHENLLDYIDSFFRLTFKHSRELGEILVDSTLIGQYRNSNDGGHLLLRPIGWDMYTQVILSSLTKENTDLEKAIKLVNAKDLNLSGSILANKVWSIKQKRITKVSAKSQKAVEKQLLAQ